MQPPRGAIFDLDGTLADTLRDLVASLNWALGQRNLAQHAPKQVRLWVGDGLAMLVRRAAGDADEPTRRQIADDVRRHYRKHCLDTTRPYPGIEELLDTLSGGGIKTAVLSNKPHEFTVQIVEALFGKGRFDTILGCSDEEARKPDPRLALQVAGRWGLAPKQVAVVGDSAVDIATARAAGMRAVAVTWGYRDRSQLETATPDALVDSPVELQRFLAT